MTDSLREEMKIRPSVPFEDDILEAGNKFDGHVTNGSHAAIMSVIRQKVDKLIEELEGLEREWRTDASATRCCTPAMDPYEAGRANRLDKCAAALKRIREGK